MPTTTYQSLVLTILCAIFLVALYSMWQNAPVVREYVAEIQQSHVTLEQAQKQLIAAQVQQQQLLERIVGLQSQFVENMEIEVFLLSKPQSERPEFPMPEGLRRRFQLGE